MQLAKLRPKRAYSEATRVRGICRVSESRYTCSYSRGTHNILIVVGEYSEHTLTTEVRLSCQWPPRSHYDLTPRFYYKSEAS